MNKTVEFLFSGLTPGGNHPHSLSCLSQSTRGKSFVLVDVGSMNVAVELDWGSQRASSGSQALAQEYSGATQHCAKIGEVVIDTFRNVGML